MYAKPLLASSNIKVVDHFNFKSKYNLKGRNIFRCRGRDPHE